MKPSTRKVMVWAGAAAQMVFLFQGFMVIRWFTPALADIVRRAQWTMLPNPTRLLLAHPNLAAAIPLVLIGALGVTVGLVQLRLREEADQLVYALIVQVVFWVLSITYVGAVGMAAILPFLHVAAR